MVAKNWKVEVVVVIILLYILQRIILTVIRARLFELSICAKVVNKQNCLDV